jgi:magnesium transporter
MTEVLATRPVPVSRVWSGSKIIAEDVQGEDLGDVLNHSSDASAWWVLPRDQDEAGPVLRHAAQVLEIDDLALKDLLAEDRRAKFESLGQSRIVVTNAVALDRQKGELSVQPVSMVVTDRALICLVDPVADGVNPARLLASRAPALADDGLERALQIVLGAVIGTYEAAVEWLEDASDELEQALFDERALTKQEQLTAFRLRSVLSQLRRLTQPMRDVMDDAVEGAPPDPLATRRWTILAERHHRVANAVEGLRETLSAVFDTSLAMADLRMNVIMKQLTGWAAIIAVPTLVTGFAGMNVSFPLDGTSAGFWVYLLVMLVAVVVLYLMFKAKDWI